MSCSRSSSSSRNSRDSILRGQTGTEAVTDAAGDRAHGGTDAHSAPAGVPRRSGEGAAKSRNRGAPPLQKDLRPLNAESFKTAFKRWAGLGAGCKGEREAQVPAAGGDAGRRREDGRGGGPAAPAVPADLRPRQPAVQLHHAHGRRRFPAVGQEPLLLRGTEEGAQLRPALPPPNAPPRRDCDPRKRGTVGGPFSQKSTVLKE